MMLNFNYKHIIWDWNGTLLDDVWLCVEVINGVLQRRGRAPVTAADYQALFDFPVRDYYQKLGFDFSAEPFSTLNTEFIIEYERRRPECCLRTGAPEILRGFFERGVPQSILSASKQNYLRQAVEALKIADMFVAVAGLDHHLADGKVELGGRLMAELKLRPGEALLIGDTRHDYEVAQAIGADCYLVSGGHQSDPRLTACGVPLLESFASLSHLSLSP